MIINSEKKCCVVNENKTRYNDETSGSFPLRIIWQPTLITVKVAPLRPGPLMRSSLGKEKL